ncbi:hypothetical protein P8452_27144 [Trifolium repens]|nr:hypothetical protein P8452_27144 [Trifolium repens]
MSGQLEVRPNNRVFQSKIGDDASISMFVSRQLLQKRSVEELILATGAKGVTRLQHQPQALKCLQQRSYNGDISHVINRESIEQDMILGSPWQHHTTLSSVWKWDIEKHPFQLRNFIAATGVEQIRQEILHVCLFVFLKLHVSVRSDVNTTA